jgi:hypothetical protein
LLVVPVLYALWFRVREHDAMKGDVAVDSRDSELDVPLAPTRIAAE